MTANTQALYCPTYPEWQSNEVSGEISATFGDKVLRCHYNTFDDGQWWVELCENSINLLSRWPVEAEALKATYERTHNRIEGMS